VPDLFVNEDGEDDEHHGEPAARVIIVYYGDKMIPTV
jgi:hypothetical protein